MTPSDTTDRPGLIKARPVRHPGRWVAIAFLAVLAAMLVNSFATNAKWNWPFTLQIMNYKPVIDGLIMGTLVCTIGSMVIGFVLGVVVAVMRLSSNPVLKGVGFVYVWFFRGIPRYVLILIAGVGLGYLYPVIDLGLPFGQTFGLTFGQVNINAFSSTIWMGMLALGLSEAGYMAEIARAGILSVDKGQTEAAQALGMSPRRIMWRIVLPQAMRVIIPPTGNETIAMVKDTSLLMGLPLVRELLFQTNAIGNRTLQIMPALMAATLWYLIICSVLMVVQYYLERHFGRGFGQSAPRSKAQQLLARTGEH